MQKLYADVAKALRSNKMAKIKIWPHEEICPNGAEIESLPFTRSSFHAEDDFLRLKKIENNA